MLAVADEIQPPALVYVYVSTCTPVPAAAGEKLTPVTPGPLYTPPSGEPPIILNGAAVAHTELTGNAKLTEVGPNIVRFVEV